MLPVRGWRAQGTDQAPSLPLLLRIPPIAFVLSKLGFRGTTGLFY
jgi:hypothetical protein